MIGCINRARPTKAAVEVAVLALILAQARGFHQQFALRQNRPNWSKTPARDVISATTIAAPKDRAISMSSSPWPQPEDGSGAPFSLPTLLEEGPLCILDPEVRETDKGYALTFNLPAEVTEDGLDVSVR